MMTAYEHCEHCGRPIPEGDAYCGFCHGIAGTNVSDLDMIHDPETDPLPHHEFPETDQRPFSLKNARRSDTDGQAERKLEPTE